MRKSTFCWGIARGSLARGGSSSYRRFKGCKRFKRFTRFNEVQEVQEVHEVHEVKGFERFRGARAWPSEIL
jgi:hypothetical protein